VRRVFVGHLLRSLIWGCVGVAEALGSSMSDFFILSGVVLVHVFMVLAMMVQYYRKQLKTARMANDYLARRLAGEAYANRTRIRPESDDDVRALRAQIDRELREYLHGEHDIDPHAWEMRGNPRSYR
jgi:hypothetical protein